MYAQRPHTKIAAALFVTAAVLFSAAAVLAQMPGWITFRDKDGNRYFVDQTGKFITEAKPEFAYKPVSADGIDYYLSQGISLIKNHYKVQGLALLKSICALPSSTSRIIEAQKNAARTINALKKNEGTRYSKIDKQALVFYRSGSETVIIDTQMNYRAVSTKNILIKKMTSHILPHYSRSGLVFGLLDKQNPEPDSAVDYLVSIDADHFERPFSSAEAYEVLVRKNNPDDSFTRRILKKTDSAVLYSIEWKDKLEFYGCEAFYIRGNFGYVVRIVSCRTPKENFLPECTAFIEKFSPTGMDTEH